MTKFEVAIRQFTHSRFDTENVEQRRREGSLRLKKKHQLKSNFRATPEICSMHEGDRGQIDHIRLEGFKGARAYPLDAIMLLLTSFRLRWVLPRLFALRSARLAGHGLIDSIGDVFVVRDFVHLPLFDQGLKFRKSKGSRSFRDRWRHLLVLNDRGLWGRMSICAISFYLLSIGLRYVTSVSLVEVKDP